MLLLEVFTNETQIQLGVVSTLLVGAFGVGAYVRGALRTDTEQQRVSALNKANLKLLEQRVDILVDVAKDKHHSVDLRLDRLERVEK